MLKPLSNENSIGSIYNFERCEEERNVERIGIEKKAVTLTMGANEDAQVAEALTDVG
jgi:hypothetical protein